MDSSQIILIKHKNPQSRDSLFANTASCFSVDKTFSFFYFFRKMMLFIFNNLISIHNTYVRIILLYLHENENMLEQIIC